MSELNYLTWVKPAVDDLIAAGLLNEYTVRNPSSKRWKDQMSDFVIEMFNLGQGSFGIVWNVSYFDKRY